MRSNRKFALCGLLLVLGACPVRIPGPILPRPPDWMGTDAVVDPEESAARELEALRTTKAIKYEAEHDIRTQTTIEVIQIERPGF